MILFKRLSVYSIFSVLNVLLTVMAADLVITNYGEDQFIQYSRILLYASVITPILTFALPSWLSNNANQIAGVPSLPMLASLIIFLSLVGCLIVLFIFKDDSLCFRALIISYSATTAMFSVCISFLQFLRHLKKFLILQMIYTGFNFASIALLAAEFSNSPFVRFEIVILGHISAIALGLVLGLWSVRGAKYEIWRSAIIWGIRLLPHTALSAFLLTGDKILFEEIFDGSLFSQYMLLAALVAPFNIFVMLVNQVLKPEFYEYLEEKKFSDVINLAYLQSGLYFALAVTLSGFCWLMFYKLGFGNNHFQLGYSTIALVVLNNVFLAFYYPLSNIILFYKHTGRLVSGTILYFIGLSLVFFYFSVSVSTVNDFLITICLLSMVYVSFYIFSANRALSRANAI